MFQQITLSGLGAANGAEWRKHHQRRPRVRFRTQAEFEALHVEMRRLLLGVRIHPCDGSEIVKDNCWGYSCYRTHDVAPGDQCVRCEKPATRRAWLNIWGTLCEFNSCDPCHIERHGKWADSF